MKVVKISGRTKLKISTIPYKSNTLFHLIAYNLVKLEELFISVLLCMKTEHRGREALLHDLVSTFLPMFQPSYKAL